jgi:hypothetical protein
VLHKWTNRNKVFKFLTVDPVREWGELKCWLIGKSEDKRGDRFELSKFEILTFYTLEVTSCKRETEASSDYIVLMAHPHIQHICKSNNRAII